MSCRKYAKPERDGLSAKSQKGVLNNGFSGSERLWCSVRCGEKRFGTRIRMKTMIFFGVINPDEGSSVAKCAVKFLSGFGICVHRCGLYKAKHP